MLSLGTWRRALAGMTPTPSNWFTFRFGITTANGEDSRLPPSELIGLHRTLNCFGVLWPSCLAKRNSLYGERL